jgi:Ser/Thr protein kinase RdoA (MazF antagonist)
LSKGTLIGEGRIAEIYAWGDNQVLKLFHEWCAPDWVDYEAGIARTVHAAGVASPAVGEVVEVNGRRGIVFERIYGRPMTQQLTRKPWTLMRGAHLLAELHAAMHTREVPELAPLRRRLEEKIRSAEPLSASQREAAFNALDPLPDDNVLCHGDFHPDNVLISSQGAMIIDWPDATRGHPLADVARTSLILRAGALPPGSKRRWLLQSLRALFHTAYLRRYFQLHSRSRTELAGWQLPVTAARLSEGIPEETEQLLMMVDATLAR